MNLTTLLLYIGIAGLLITLVTFFLLKKKDNFLISFLQNFCGALFIFSGGVKAVDPLGTAYKMEEYFTEFVQTFEPTWFSFLNPMFNWMHDHSVGFSVFVIVFEIVLGIMLILGALPRLTSWLFFLLVLFFTVLTGFTFTTGYVPEGINYFDFSNWVAHTETNMKVTDCGCFGDFIKLKPFTSFMKDVFLLFPAVLFLFKHRSFHNLFSKGMRWTLLIISILGLTIFCVSNYSWNLPIVDFRAFSEGTDVRAQKIIEDDATNNVEVLHYNLTNKETGEKKQIGYEDYLSNYKQYPKASWSAEQVLSEPTIEPTKISDFSIEDFEDREVTDLYLNPEGGYRFMIVSYTMKGKSNMEERIVQDTILSETFEVNGKDTMTMITPNIVERKEEITVYDWEESYKNNFVEKIKPLAVSAKKINIPTDVVVGGATLEQLIDFQTKYDLPVNYHKADDILLKTIVRSNPGVVLWHNGVIVAKWHIKKLPDFKEIKENYIKQ